MTTSAQLEWHKLLARGSVDLPTISEIDVVFYELIQDATLSREKLFFTYFKDTHLTHYIGCDPKIVGRFIYKKYFDKPSQIVGYYKKGKKLMKETKKETAFWSKKLGKKPSSKTVLKAFLKFEKSFSEISRIFSIISWFGIEIWQQDFEDTLNEMILRNSLESQRGQILTSIYKPWKKTALIEIQEKMAKGVPIEQLVREYQFLRSWTVIWFSPITQDWFKSIQISASKETKKALSHQKLLALLKPSQTQKALIKIAPYIVFFKDWRDDLRRNHVFQWSFLFDAIAKQFGVPRQDLGNLALDEIETVLSSGNFPGALVRQRKQNGCIVSLKKPKPIELETMEGIPAQFKEIIQMVETEERPETVTGKIAQKGIAKGPVKIIRSYHDIKHVREGDILIANSTHPTYLPAMQKAAAFVTNEGGLISHAAIVAREMKKPCIVGTKIATKVFNDGDLVIVDADNGIVKKLDS